MGFEKSIFYGKEKRKIYRKAKAFDVSCRNHGDCPWCFSNRNHNNIVRDIEAKDQIKEYLEGLSNE